MSSDEIVVDARNLSKHYDIYAAPHYRLKQMLVPRLYRAARRFAGGRGFFAGRAEPRYYREFRALENVSFQLRRGETMGIIGRNGSGKSTLLQIVAGTLAPTSGEVSVNGRVAALLELGSGFNPEYSGRDNVFLNARILGLNQKEIEARYDRIVEFADIGEFIDRPVKTYSSGMFLRLAFAVQAHIDASIVIIDEALAVGDVFFRQKCYRRLEQLREQGAAIILVSHSMGDIEHHCDRAILLDHGQALHNGPAAEAVKKYYLIEQQERMPQADAAPALDTPPLPVRDAAHAPFPDEALFPLDGIAQINACDARCLRVALTDIHGRPRRSFRFGETAVFHHEHYFGSQAGVPAGGVVIRTEKGVILHGKSSLQTRTSVPPAAPGSIVRFEHRVVLTIAQGEYTFDIGMSTMDADSFMAMERVSHAEADQLKIRLVQVPGVAAFTMLPPDPSRPLLVHHGLVDLPTEIQINVFAP